MQPCSVRFAKVLYQPWQAFSRQLSDGDNPQPLQLGTSLGANAIDLAARQWPDLVLHILRHHDRNTLGLVELAGHLGQ